MVVSNDISKKKEQQEQMKNAEKKYQSLIEKRNELNDIAKLFRDERDMLNDKRKEIIVQMKENKEDRDKLVSEMRRHKEIRNKLQQEAKELIKSKQKKRGDVIRNLPLRIEELKADVQMLEYKQETVPMNTKDENDLIDQIKIKRREFNRGKNQLEKQQLIETDLSDTDTAITELFKKADEEHEMVQKYYNESQKKHEEYSKYVTEISTSINESNKKHKKYIEIKDEAQRHHEKALEMLSKIMSVKKEKRKHWQEAKEILQKQNIKAQKEVFNKEKLAEIAEESVSDLKKGKKISLT